MVTLHHHTVTSSYWEEQLEGDNRGGLLPTVESADGSHALSIGSTVRLGTSSI